MHQITHAEVKELKKLHTRSGRKALGMFLVVGKKVVTEAVYSGLEVTTLLTTQKFREQNPEFLSELPQIDIAEKALGVLDISVTPSGVLAVVRTPRGTVFEKLPDLLVCLVDIQDPGNLGTMIRTADWFGAGGVLITATTVDPFNEKVVASAMGSLFRVPITTSIALVDDLKKLKQAGYSLIGTSSHGSTNKLPQSGKRCIIMGSESLGLSQSILDLCTDIYTIPGDGAAESLNVAVSFGITMHVVTNT